MIAAAATATPPAAPAPAPLRRMTIRYRLGVALAAALLPILVLAGIQTFAGFEQDARVRRASLVQAADRSAIEARARVQGAVALLETITPQSVGLQCASRLGNVLGQLSGYTNLVRLDAFGRVECAGASVAPNPDRGKRAWFVRLRKGEHFVLDRSSREGPPSIIAAVRVSRPDGAFDGAFVAVMPLASLRPDLGDPTLPAGTEVALADTSGRLLLQTDPQAFAPLPAGFASRETLYSARDAAGRLRTQVASPLIKGSVYVVLSAPAPGVLSWARLNPFASIVLPLLTWIAAWLTVWVVIERIVVRWLAYLDRIAQLYARGRFSVRAVQAAQAPQEIRDLAETLDAMAEAIVQRDMALHDNLAQKDAMMREIHHRVKNNLQVITSLLNMQQRALGDPAAKAAIYDTRQRITALALIYRALYQSADLKRVDVRQFLEELVAQQVAGESQNRSAPLRTDLQADDLEVDPDKLAPLALFAVEAVTQARRHVFPSEGGRIHVRFRVGEEVTLEIEDDGREAVGEDPSGGVGRTLMTAYARQLRGRSTLETTDGGHVRVRLSFPAPEPAPPAPPTPAPLGEAA